jgi:hypothetical protein
MKKKILKKGEKIEVHLVSEITPHRNLYAQNVIDSVIECRDEFEPDRVEIRKGGKVVASSEIMITFPTIEEQRTALEDFRRREAAGEKFKTEVIFDDSHRRKEGICVACNGKAIEFTDEISKREYEETGLCQKCQDEIYPDHDVLTPEEIEKIENK